jgi:hypothetical protein
VDISIALLSAGLYVSVMRTLDKPAQRHISTSNIKGSPKSWCCEDIISQADIMSGNNNRTSRDIMRQHHEWISRDKVRYYERASRDITSGYHETKRDITSGHQETTSRVDIRRQCEILRADIKRQHHEWMSLLVSDDEVKTEAKMWFRELRTNLYRNGLIENV